MTEHLAPIAPTFRSTAPTTLILKEKKMSFTGDSATIKDSNGNKLFKIDAKAMTLSQRRSLLDSDGNEIAQLRLKRIPGFHPACYIGTMSDEKACKVKAKGIMNITKCDANIYIGGEKVGSVSGNWRAKKFSITIDGREVATGSRNTNFASLVLDADSYCINVNEAGVDLAFISLITISLDELYHDDDD